MTDFLKDGGPAHPVNFDFQKFKPENDEVARRLLSGMSLRDYFAAKAMQALIAAPDQGTFDTIAMDAYELADAMLKARSA